MVPLKAPGQNPSVPLQVQVEHFNLCLRGHVAFSLCLCVFSSDSSKGLTETLAIGFKAHSNTPESSHLRILNSFTSADLFSDKVVFTGSGAIQTHGGMDLSFWGHQSKHYSR